MIEVSAPGNVFFFGEHSVVYGRPAVVTAISKRTYVKIEPSEEIIAVSKGYGELEIRNWKVKYCDQELEPLKHLILKCKDEFKIDSGFRMTIWSEIDKESGGMSSSTAFLTAVFHAMNLFFDWEIKKDDYIEFLMPFQREIHGGAASGAEFVSSVFGGFHILKKVDRCNKEFCFDFQEAEGNFKIIIGDTGIEAKTKNIVSQTRALYEREPEKYEELFSKFEKVVEDGLKCIKTEDTNALGECMDENQKLLKELDLLNQEVNNRWKVFDEVAKIVSPELEVLIKSAKEAGALGAKVSGGGGGGIMIALVEDEKPVERALKTIAKRVNLVKIGEKGVSP